MIVEAEEDGDAYKVVSVESVGDASEITVTKDDRIVILPTLNSDYKDITLFMVVSGMTE